MPSKVSKPIILIEPQCRGREHIPFNLALLRTAQIAAGNRTLIFAAESSHLREVQQAWIRRTFPGPTPHWIPIEIPERQLYGWPRMVPEWHSLRGWLPQIESLHPAAVLFTSVTPNLLLILKTLHRQGFAGAQQVLVVPHQNLDGVRHSKPWKRPWRWPLHMATALSTANPAWLRVVVLGQSLLESCREVLGDRAVSDWSVIDHPYLFPDVQHSPPTASSGPLTFGYFGSNTNGLRSFAQLAELVQPGNPQLRFLLAGYASSELEHSRHVEGWGIEPLSSEEYAARASQFDFTVWTASPALYDFTASAAFLDALAYGKPLIYLANRFIDFYVKQSGPIGYRVERFEDLPALILDLSSRNMEQADFASNMAALRNCFSPERQADRLSMLLKLPDA